MQKILRGNSGQAVMQALMGAVVTGMVVVGSIAVVNQQKKRTNEMQLSVKTTEIQKRLQEMLRDDRAWKNTVASNANLTCLVSAASCINVGWPLDANQLGSPFDVIYQATGAIYFNDTTQGFDETGAVCAPVGDRCPYTVELSWQAVQPNSAGAQCTVAPTQGGECSVKIIARITYNPAAGKRSPYKENNYRVSFLRESDAQQQFFVIADQKADETPGGTCNTSGYSPRILNTEVTDNGDNVTGFVDAGGAAGTEGVVVKKGTYQCEVTAPVNNVEQHQARLLVDEDGDGTYCEGLETYTGSSAYYATPSVIKATFTIEAATGVLCVEHQCRKKGGAPSVATDLGAPIIDTSNTIETYTVMKCKKLSN